MAIDHNIISGLKPIQFDSPVSALAKMLQVQGAQQQNQLGQAKLDEYQSGVQRTNRLRALLGGMTPDMPADQQVGELTRGGFLTEARSLAESSAKVATEKRAAEKAQLEAMSQKLALGAQILGSAKDQVSYDAARQTAQQAGLDVSNMPPQFDAGFVQAKRTEGLTALQQIEQHWKKMNYDLDLKKADETARHNTASEVLTARGQNMVDARAREQSTTGKLPVGYRQGPNGSLEAIPGGPADKHAVTTEGERKAATLLSRLTSSQQQLAAALKEDASAAQPGLLANGLRTVGAEALANTATGSARQRVDSAQLDILDAALTLGTGAAYTREQLEGYRKSYFPQIGDSKANIADKAARLENILEAARISAGRAAPARSAVPAAPQQPAPRGAKFLGFE